MSSNANEWLKDLTDAELVFWNSQPQEQKDNWEANIPPKKRALTVRKEIRSKANQIRFNLRILPEEQTKAILDYLDARAEVAKNKLRAMLGDQTE